MNLFKYLFFTLVVLLNTSSIAPVLANTPNPPPHYFDTFLSAYRHYGNSQYMIQEKITQTEHVLQAAHIASLVGAPEDIIIGLLFHDIGQVGFKKHVGNAEYLHLHHDDLGAGWMRKHRFPKEISDLVQYHTLIKVVLCEQEPDYYESLSQASKDSYVIQKTKYEQPENIHLVTTLKNHPRLEDYKAARRIDEMAKIGGAGIQNLKPLKYYRAMTERVRRNKGQAAKNPNWHQSVKQYHTLMKEDSLAFEKVIRPSR